MQRAHAGIVPNYPSWTHATSSSLKFVILQLVGFHSRDQRQRKFSVLQKRSILSGLIWNTNMADMTSRENTLYVTSIGRVIMRSEWRMLDLRPTEIP